jgi:glycerol kinase
VEFFRGRTGLPPASYFSAFKVRWILEHVPGARDLAVKGDLLFGTMDTFLVWNLTGGPSGGRHITDVTNASRTMLMNLVTLQWDEELLTILEIPRACCRPSARAANSYGKATADPVAGVAITGILGDQQAALVGQTCFDPGEAKTTYGTGCFLLPQYRRGAGAIHPRAVDHRGVSFRRVQGAVCA